jgi:hypothetical protein
VIDLDSSVALAWLLGEENKPIRPFWDEPIVSSRLLEYEVWNRLHARGLAKSHGAETSRLLDNVDLVELSPAVLARALEPFPVSVRTLDGLHLATVEFLRTNGSTVELASYDTRIITAATALGIAIRRL